MTALDSASIIHNDGQALHPSPKSGEDVSEINANPTCEPSIATVSASKVVVPKSPFSPNAPFNGLQFSSS